MCLENHQVWVCFVPYDVLFPGHISLACWVLSPINYLGPRPTLSTVWSRWCYYLCLAAFPPSLSTGEWTRGQAGLGLAASTTTGRDSMPIIHSGVDRTDGLPFLSRWARRKETVPSRRTRPPASSLRNKKISSTLSLLSSQSLEEKSWWELAVWLGPRGWSSLGRQAGHERPVFWSACLLPQIWL